MTKKIKHPHNYKELDEKLIIKLYKSGLSMAKIAVRLETTSATICNRLKKHNISRKKGFQKGKNNTSWKGGKNTLRMKCLQCGKKISKERKGRNVICFCNHTCCGKYRKGKKLYRENTTKKRKIFDESKMIYLYKLGLSLVEVGRVFNVSANTISKRLDKYGVEKHKPFGGNGKEHYNWNGGVYNTLNRAIRCTRKYRTWRTAIFKRDNFTCQKCNVRGGKLEAHHNVFVSNIITKDNLNTLEEAIHCKLLWDKKNGTTLCRNCHLTVHRNRDN